MDKTSGQHILADFYKCQCDIEWLTSIDKIKDILWDKIKENNLTPLTEAYHIFNLGSDGTAYSLTIILEESHLNLHTFPEEQFISMDCYTCNYSRDNTEATENIYEFLKSIFKPKKVDYKFIERGRISEQ